MSHAELIGKRVLSPKFGVGIIESVESMGGRDFLVAFSQEQNTKNFLPIDNQTEYRFLSTEDEVQSCIEGLKPHADLIDFASKQERINYFKSESKIQNLEKISFLLCELAGIDDRGTVEEASLNKLIDTLSLEVSLVLDMAKVTASKTIKENLEL